MKPTVTRLENGIIKTVYQQWREERVVYSYEFGGHAGYIRLACERVPGVIYHGNNGHQGYGNSCSMITFENPDTLDRDLKAIWRAYANVVAEKQEQAKANRGKTPEKPAPKPRPVKPEKPLKQYECSIDQKGLKKYYEGYPSQYREWPVRKIQATTRYKAEDQYEKEMEQEAKLGGYRFNAGLFTKIKEIKEG